MKSILRQISDQQNPKDMLFGYKDNIRLIKPFKYIISHINTGSKILDVGCANGYFSVNLLDAGYKCYGLEIDKKLAFQARQNGIKVYVGSFLKKFPFKSGFFDIIFAGEVIEHTFDDRVFLKELYRVLKVNGILVVTAPNLLSLTNRALMMLGFMPRFAYTESHYRFYNFQTLNEKIKTTGFKIIKTDSSYVLMSKYYNKYIGMVGELLGTLLPTLGENFIIYAVKK